MNTEQEPDLTLLLDKEWERQQIKSFTAWINFQLKRAGLSIKDISTDLRDGKILIRLLELISGDHLPPAEKKNLRLHQINNVNRCIEFIGRKGVRLAGTGSEEIVDGNLKMTLGCIWCIILRFAIQNNDELLKNDGLLLWVRKKTEGYKGVNVKNFTGSFRDGLAFNALIHRHRPDLLDYSDLSAENDTENLTQAFEIAEKHLGIPRMLDVEDTRTAPDQKSVMTYLSAFYQVFSKMSDNDVAKRRIYKVLDTNAENAKKIQEYEKIASDLMKWIDEKTEEFTKPIDEDQSLEQLLENINDINKYRKNEKPPKAKEKATLESLTSAIKTRMFLQKRSDYVPTDGHSIKDIQLAWDKLNIFEKTRLDRFYLKAQQLYYISHLYKKFQYKCDQQDIWMSGRLEPLRIDVSEMLMPEITACKKKMIGLKNDVETPEFRLKVISLIIDQLKKATCQQVPAVEERYAQLTKEWQEYIEAQQSFVDKLGEREKYLINLDDLKQKYAQIANKLKACFDLALEDLNDTYQVRSVHETDKLKQELEVFIPTLEENKHQLNEALELEIKIKNSSDPVNLYCSLSGSDLSSRLEQVNAAFIVRKEMLDNEYQSQIKNEKLREEFAKVAEEIEIFKNSCLQRVNNVTMSSGTLEDHVAIIKKVAEDVDVYYRDRSPRLDQLGSCMQEKQVFHNPLTSHTFESIISDHQNLYDVIASAINEIENQIIVRDSTNISDQQVKDYWKSFDYFDNQHKGELSIEDFRSFLVSLEFKVTAEDPKGQIEFQRIVKIVDPLNTGRVNFNSFLSFVAVESKDRDTAEQIVESFKAIAGGKDYILPETIKSQLPDKANEIISKMSPSTLPDAPPGALDFKSFAAAIYGESEL